MSWAPSEEEFNARIAAYNREQRGQRTKPTAEVVQHPKSNGSAKPQPELSTTRATSFAMRAVTWFWPGRFALGKLGLIGGLPDKGKGLISADIIARCTTGADWPVTRDKPHRAT
jgi:hypothetical protein